MLQNTVYYQNKIAEKRADLEMLQEFRQLTAELASNLETAGNQLETMKDGTESVAHILANWQNVIKSVSLASLGLLKYTDNDYEESAPLPEPLVRIKLVDEEGSDDEGN